MQVKRTSGLVKRDKGISARSQFANEMKPSAVGVQARFKSAVVVNLGFAINWNPSGRHERANGFRKRALPLGGEVETRSATARF